MKSASNTLPDQPFNGVTAGVDWAGDDHAVSVVNDRGREIDRRTIEHSTAGLRELLDLLARHGAQEVAIERPDGPVVEALLEGGITVVVISPNQRRICAAATAPRAARTTGSTRSSSPTPSAPTGPGSPR